MRFIRPTLAAVTVAAVLLGGATIAAPMAGAAATPAAVAAAMPVSGTLFGAAVYSPEGASIADLETATGRTMGVERLYADWDDALPSWQMRAAVAAGRTPLVSITPMLRSSHTKIGWQSIADGDQDTEIRAQIAALVSLGAPVLLAFHHEADLSTGYGTAAQFRAAFRHYVTVARATGQTTVSFVVVLAANTYRSSAIGDWYPGDDVVDWAGADAYNFAACRSGLPAWRSFADAVAPFRSWGAAHDKPQVLAEWGSAEDPASPGRKADWITAAGEQMKSWTTLRAAAYFDEQGTCDWRLTTSSSAAGAFTTLARSAWANGRPTARIWVRWMSGHAVGWDAEQSTGSAHITTHGTTSWTFDPGTGPVQSGTGRPVQLSATYPVAGRYTAVLTVRDANGMSATTHRTITVP